METKLSQVRRAMREGDWAGALRLAAKFHDLGEHKRQITLGHEALVRPGFYAQLRRDPAALVEAGKAALVARYGFGE